jgi:hypothetical protein
MLLILQKDLEAHVIDNCMRSTPPLTHNYPNHYPLPGYSLDTRVPGYVTLPER